MIKPRLCAIDVDGTLVGPDKTIGEVNGQGVSEYVGSGGRILLASGRMHSSVVRYAEQLNLTGDDLILSYNGAMARSVAGELLFERPVPAQQAAEVVELCARENLHLNYYYNDLLYVRELNDRSRAYFERSGSPSIPVGDLATLAGTTPTKLLVFAAPERLDALVPGLVEQYIDTLYITKTDDDYLEFMAKGVNKGAALEELAIKLGIPQSEIAAFGDSYNDVEMLIWAGLGVAMSNGRIEARNVADRIVDNSNWSAVGTVLREFVSQAEGLLTEG